MVEAKINSLQDYFCTVGGGMETFAENEILELGSSYIRDRTDGKVYFSSSLPVAMLLSLKTAERLFILVHKRPQFLISQTKRDALKRFCSLAEGNDNLNWCGCLEKWKDFHAFVSKDRTNLNDRIRFRVSCKCSGKIKHAFSPVFLGKIFGGSLLNIHPKWIPDLRRPELQVVINATMETLTIGLACCPFNETLSKRSYFHNPHGNSFLRPTICSAMLSTALRTLNKNPLVSAEASGESHERGLNVHNPRIILDPMCGTGMILAEAASYRNIENDFILLGSDFDSSQLDVAHSNIREAESAFTVLRKCCYSSLFVADARALPLSDNSVDFIISDLPFGLKHFSKPWPRQKREECNETAESEGGSAHPESLEIHDSREVTSTIRKIIDDEDDKREKLRPEMDDNIDPFQVSANSDSVRGAAEPIPDEFARSKGTKRKRIDARDVQPSKLKASSGDSGTVEDVRKMLPQIVLEMDRVLVKGGRVSLLISETLRPSLIEAVNAVADSNICADFKHGEQGTSSFGADGGTSVHFDYSIKLTPSANNCPPVSSTNANVMVESSVDDKQRPVKPSWTCCEQHKVKLGVLDAVICVFSK